VKRKLSNPKESLAGVRKSEHYAEHGTSIRELIGPEGMRKMGKALDTAHSQRKRRR
jgi:hypothetical protein